MWQVPGGEPGHAPAGTPAENVKSLPGRAGRPAWTGAKPARHPPSSLPSPYLAPVAEGEEREASRRSPVPAGPCWRSRTRRTVKAKGAAGWLRARGGDLAAAAAALSLPRSQLQGKQGPPPLGPEPSQQPRLPAGSHRGPSTRPPATLPGQRGLGGWLPSPGATTQRRGGKGRRAGRPARWAGHRDAILCSWLGWPEGPAEGGLGGRREQLLCPLLPLVKEPFLPQVPGMLRFLAAICLAREGKGQRSGVEVEVV